MLRALDEAPVTRRYLILTAAVMIGAVLDLFDFFLIAFVVPILNDEWDLTFGQAAVMLLSAGFGAIAGSILWGRFGDRYGRRRPADRRAHPVLARDRRDGACAGRWLVVHRDLQVPRRRRCCLLYTSPSPRDS